MPWSLLRRLNLYSRQAGSVLEQHVSFQQVSGKRWHPESCLLQGRMKWKRKAEGLRTPVQANEVSRFWASDSQLQSARTAWNGTVTRASSVFWGQNLPCPFKFRKAGTEAAANVLKFWSVFLEQYKSCEKDQLRKWRRQKDSDSQ